MIARGAREQGRAEREQRHGPGQPGEPSATDGRDGRAAHGHAARQAAPRVFDRLALCASRLHRSSPRCDGRPGAAGPDALVLVSAGRRSSPKRHREQKPVGFAALDDRHAAQLELVADDRRMLDPDCLQLLEVHGLASRRAQSFDHAALLIITRHAHTVRGRAHNPLLPGQATTQARCCL